MRNAIPERVSQTPRLKTPTALDDLDPQRALAAAVKQDGEDDDGSGITEGLHRLEDRDEEPDTSPEAHEAERPVSYELFKQSLLDESALPPMLHDKMTGTGPLRAKMQTSIQHYELGMDALQTDIASKDLTPEQKRDMWESATELASAAMLDELVGMINEELNDEERRELVTYLESVGVKDVLYIVNFSRNDSYVADHPESLEAAPVHMDPVRSEQATESAAVVAEPVTSVVASSGSAPEAVSEPVTRGNEFTIERMQELFRKRGQGVTSTEEAIKLVVLGREHFEKKSTGMEARLDTTQEIKIHILATALNSIASFSRVDKMASGPEKVRAFSYLLTQKYIRDRLAAQVPKIRSTK